MAVVNGTGPLMGPERHRPLLAYTADPSGYRQGCAELLPVMRAVAARNLMLQSQLERLLHAWAQASVSVLLLKGAALVPTVYPPGTRLLGDLDLLVAPGRLAAADAVLTELGYRLAKPGLPDWMRRELAGKYEYVPPGPHLGHVDLHVTLGPHPYLGRVPIRWLWRRSRRVRVGAVRARVPAPEHLLIHACLHALHHAHDDGVPSLCDAAAIARHYPLDWNAMRALASAWGVAPALLWGLRAARLLAPGAGIPDWPLPDVARQSRAERAWLAACGLGSSAAQRYAAQLLAHPRPGLRLRVLVALLLAPPPLVRELAEHPGGSLPDLYARHYLGLLRAGWSVLRPCPARTPPFPA